MRHVLGQCEFNEADCSEGLKALRSYRKEWDEERGVWRDKPRHDWAVRRRRCLPLPCASRYRDYRPRLGAKAAAAGERPLARRPLAEASSTPHRFPSWSGPRGSAKGGERDGNVYLSD